MTKTERWRDRAEELRAIAESFKEASAKRDLLALSRKWEEMADKAERQSGKDGPPKQPSR